MMGRAVNFAVQQLRLPLLRNGYALILSSGATSALGMLFWILAARLYAPEVVGLNSALLSSMAFFGELLRFNLGSALIRFLPAAGSGARKLVTRIYLISVLAPLVALVIVLVNPHLLSTVARTVHLHDRALVWFVIGITGAVIFALQDAVLAGLRQSVWIPLENGLFALAKVALLVQFRDLFPPYGIFLAWLAPLLVTIVPVNILIFSRLLPARPAVWQPPRQKLDARIVAKYVVGDFVGDIFYLASITILPLLVVRDAGVATNAYFAQAWLIASSLQLVTVNMALSLTVEGARDPERLGYFTRRTLRHVTRIMVVVVAVTVVGAPFILGVFGSHYAAAGTPLLQLLALSALPYIVITLFMSVARVRRDIRGIIVVQGALCGGILSLSYLLLPLLGITGIGVAWLATVTVVSSILYVVRIRTLISPATDSATAATSGTPLPARS